MLCTLNHVSCIISLVFVVVIVRRDVHVERAFTVPSDHNKSCYDVVINLAAETRQGQLESLYEARCTHLARLCAKKAAEVGVKRFIQVLYITFCLQDSNKDYLVYCLLRCQQVKFINQVVVLR